MKPEQLQAFAELVERQQMARLKANDLGCEVNLINAKTSIKPGRKYTKVDIGPSGAYMIVNATGEIFGIKAYGAIHKGHYYGTLDTIAEWNWGEYRAYKIN